MCAAGFPEPKTFSTAGRQAAAGPRRRLRHRPRQPGARLRDARDREDGAAAAHHDPPPDHLRPAHRPRRRPATRGASSRCSRWYGFLRMQGRVARKARMILTPSETSKRDIAKDFGVDPARMQVILLGVDDGFVPPTEPRVPGPDHGDGQRRRPDEGHRDPARGVRQAAHRARRRADPGHQAASPAAAPSSSSTSSSIADSVRFVHGISEAELVELMGSAEVACVPSLYEGFSLPTAELMACATPLIVSRAGAIPEVVGPGRLCADLVTPGDVGELEAALARAARRPRAPGADGRRRPASGSTSCSAGAPSRPQVAAAYEEVIADYHEEQERQC